MALSRSRRVLQLIVDCQRPRATVLDRVRAAVEAGADWVQVRDHQVSARELYDLACQVKEICRSSSARLVVNDRVDVALAAQADGVQLGARGLDPRTVRQIAPRLAVGLSIHSPEEARRATGTAVDWLTFGHVFATSSHPGEAPRGIAALEDVIRAVDLPVIAIGGITEENVGQVVATGAAGVAVISAILDAVDPPGATACLRRMLD